MAKIRRKSKPKANRKKTGISRAETNLIDLGFINEMADCTGYEKELELFIEEYKMEEKNLDDTEGLIEHPIDDKGQVKFSIATKKFAILLLESMVHHKGQYEGRPMYFRVGKMLNVDPRYLFNWNNRDKEAILSQVTTFDTAIKDYVKLKLNVLMLKVLNEIGNRDLKLMYDKNLVSLLNALYHKWRLEQGESTENIAVKHRIALVAPIED